MLSVLFAPLAIFFEHQAFFDLLFVAMRKIIYTLTTRFGTFHFNKIVLTHNVSKLSKISELSK